MPPQERKPARPAIEVTELFDAPTRHGLPVLNAQTPLPEVTDLISLRMAGYVRPVLVTERDVRVVDDLAGFTIIPRARIDVTEEGKQHGAQTPLAGHFVGEELHGDVHPLLLLPPDKVEKLQAE